MKKLLLALLVLTASSWLAAETMMIKTKNGLEERPVTRTLPADSGIPSPVGKTFKLAGMADDGVRKFLAGGKGTYIDGSNTGEFEWGYALIDGKPHIQPFKAWGDPYTAENSAPAASLYINFTTGKKKGESYAEIIGAPSASVMYLSTYFYAQD